MLSDSEMSLAVARTIEHYEDNAKSFWESTKDHDVNQNYAALQTNLPSLSGMTILDLGCGPGRDLIHFKKRGHTPIGIDACSVFCDMARKNSGCEVWEQNFCDLDLPKDYFDGIFANASLFHIPRKYLSGVLSDLHDCLKSKGILFSSNPRGSGEYFDGSRYGNYMEFEVYAEFLSEAGFEIIDHYYRPSGWPRAEQPWIAVVSRKV